MALGASGAALALAASSFVASKALAQPLSHDCACAFATPSAQPSTNNSNPGLRAPAANRTSASST